MDYSLLKTITPQLSYLETHSPHVRLTSMPARDFINPGFGQISRLYNFYVPLHGIGDPYRLKTIDVENDKKNQHGHGNVSESDNIETESANTLEANESSSNTSEPNESSSNEKSTNLLMDVGVLDSFKHPKIKVGKAIINSNVNIKKDFNGKGSLKKKSLKHKFNII